jgi:hypothetical protein
VQRHVLRFVFLLFVVEMFVNDVRLYAPTVKVAVMAVRSATPICVTPFHVARR